MLLAGLYLAGELARGAARGGEASATARAAAIARLERRLHVFDEATIQQAAHQIGGLSAFLGYAYVTLHLAVTATTLVWVYRRRRHAYARLRNALALASGLAVVGYVLWRAAAALYPAFALFVIVATGNHFFVDAAAGAAVAGIALAAVTLSSARRAHEFG